MKRRTFFKTCAALAADAATTQSHPAAVENLPSDAIVIDPNPRFEISPYLYMQFMEPLGTTDASVEASWNYDNDDWRENFVDAARELAPDVLRFGGLISRYYKWREGVGSPQSRPWARNYLWGGKETNRVGTHEFVDLCRRVGAEPLYCVNFLGDGHQEYARTPEGNRLGDAQEAADWVSYANDPDNRSRRLHGHAAPYGVLLWQLGNETSYDNGFTKEQSIETTLAFAEAMRARDPRIQLIGWGDSGWAGDLVQRAGEHIDYVAVHMMQQRPVRQDTVLDSFAYQKQPERAWEELMELIAARVEKKLLRVEQELDARGAKHPIAITEGHLSLAPRNINPLLSEWLTGVYHARALNLYQRHGDRVKICTAADFNGTRWTTNALMLTMPQGPCYLLPAGAVMRLFKRHNGKQAVELRKAPANLDIAASRTGTTLFLHVANMEYSRSVPAVFLIDGMRVEGGRVLEIAPEDPRQAISLNNPKVFDPQEHMLSSGVNGWRFPPRSVSVVELRCAAASVDATRDERSRRSISRT